MDAERVRGGWTKTGSLPAVILTHDQLHGIMARKHLTAKQMAERTGYALSTIQAFLSDGATISKVFVRRMREIGLL